MKDKIKDQLLNDFNKYGIDLEKQYNKVGKPEMFFVKDKFEIFSHIACCEFNKSSYDINISLADIVSLIQKTNEVFSSFDNKISIEENVKKFYERRTS